MLDIKIGDINPNGWEFTLHPAADQYNTDYESVKELLYSIYYNLGMFSGDNKKQKEGMFSGDNKKQKEGMFSGDNKKQKEDMLPDLNILDKLSVKELQLSYTAIQDLLDENLVTRNGNTIVLTSKTKEILKRAAEIQKNDYEIGFSLY